MLRVAKVRAGGHAYYLEPTGIDGRRAVEPPGRWTGRGAAAMGLQGTPVGAELGPVLQGAAPDGSPLGADRRRVTVAGYDLTFCAPKSVSLLEALSEPEVAGVVRSAHERAASAAFGYLEERALAVRRRVPGAGRVLLAAESAPAAAFTHHTSRALDPHLHTHVVLPNVARAPDGSWSAIDGRGVFAHAPAAGALYQAVLRHELTAGLGVTWGPLAGGRADVHGIGPEARREFSRRTEQIRAHLTARGRSTDDDRPPSGRARHVAGVVTRADKDAGIGPDELRAWWKERALSCGLGPRRLQAVLDRSPHDRGVPDGTGRHRAAASPDGPDHASPSAVAAALAAVRHPERPFTRRDVVRAWAGALPAGAPPERVGAVADRFMADVGAASPPGAATAHEQPDDRPGVGERRVVLPERLRGRQLDAVHRPELERLLQRRGMTLAAGAGRAVGLDFAPDRGPELGFG